MADILPNANSTTLVAFFSDYSDALAAISELKDAGFTSNEIGLATAGGNSSSVQSEDEADLRSSETRASNIPSSNIPSSNIRSSNLDSDLEPAGIHAGSHAPGKDRGVWEKIKDFFTGEEESYRGDNEAYQGAFEHLSVTGDRARYYGAGIQAGGALVTVKADTGRLEQAREILMDNDGDLRTSGFEAENFETSRSLDATARPDNADRSLQLRGEVLRAVKERVQKGEIRLRKDVVTENRTLNVPVTREEVVVERVGAEGSVPASGVIGDEKEIRIPVSEERVNVTKEQVVTGQVRVQKRTVQDTQTVSDNVQREELRVDREGDVNIADESDVTGKKTISDQKEPIRKKPAA